MTQITPHPGQNLPAPYRVVMHLATNDRETKEECVTGLPQARLVQWPTKAMGPALSPLHLQASCPHFISKRGQGQRARDVSQLRVSLSQSFLRSPSHSFHLTGRIWDPWPPLAARESGKVLFYIFSGHTEAQNKLGF